LLIGVEATVVAQWRDVGSGRWQCQDFIALGEGRAVVKLECAVAFCLAGHGHKIPSLQDNTSVAGAFSKGRSAAPALNY